MPFDSSSRPPDSLSCPAVQALVPLLQEGFTVENLGFSARHNCFRDVSPIFDVGGLSSLWQPRLRQNFVCSTCAWTASISVIQHYANLKSILSAQHCLSGGKYYFPKEVSPHATNRSRTFLKATLSNLPAQSH